VMMAMRFRGELWAADAPAAAAAPMNSRLVSMV
jgi:hypothetical protein